MTLKSCVILSVLLLGAVQFCAGQTTGSPPSNSAFRSVRPILVSIKFSGNASISSQDLERRILSKPTSRSVLNRFARMVQPLSNRVTYYLRARAAEGLELRYLNAVLVEEDRKALLRLYNERGFHTVQIRAVYGIDTARNIAALRFNIIEGDRAVVWGTRFVGLDGIPNELRKRIKETKYLRPGAPFDVVNVNLETRRVLDILQNNGYAFATERRIPEVPQCTPEDPECDDYRDSIIFHINPGSRFRFGNTKINHDIRSRRDTGDRKTGVSESLIYDLVDYQPGEWFSWQKVSETRRKLYRLGVFEQISTDTNGISESGDSLGMEIFYRLRNQNEIEGSVELSVEQRPSGLIFTVGLASNYTKLNPFGRATRTSIGGRLQGQPLINEDMKLLSFKEAEWGGDLSIDIPRPPIPLIKPDVIGVNLGYTRALEDREGDAGLLSDRRFAGIELGVSLPSYTLVNGMSYRLVYQKNQYFGVEDYINAKADALLEEVDLPDGCSPDAIREDIVKTLARTIYRVQVLQGDNPELSLNEQISEQSELLEQTLIFGGSIVGDHRNSFFTPTDGYYLEGRFDIGSTGAFSPIGGFLRLEGDARYFLPVGDSNTIAFRGHLGTIMQFGQFPLTPVSNRFHAGGANSIRGWSGRSMLVTTPPETLTDTCSAPVLGALLTDSRRLLGGLGLLEGSVEWRAHLGVLSWLYESLVGAFFVDFGNAYFQNYNDDKDLVNLKSVYENLGVSAGIDIGVITPVGPIRAGYGYRLHDPIDKQPGDRWFWQHPLSLSNGAFHFSIGYAF